MIRLNNARCEKYEKCEIIFVERVVFFFLFSTTKSSVDEFHMTSFSDDDEIIDVI